MDNGTSLVVCAIDIGTAHTGCFFSSRDTFGNNPLQIYSLLRESHSGIGTRTASCVLLNPRNEIDSFGQDAEEKYRTLVEDSSHHDWHFFKRYKMILYDRMVI